MNGKNKIANREKERLNESWKVSLLHICLTMHSMRETCLENTVCSSLGSAVHSVRTAIRWERAVYIPFSATRFLGPRTTHLWPHIVLFFDNRFSYIMNPIHIKGWTKGRLAWLQAHSEQAQTTWENKLFPIFSSPPRLPCSLSYHKRYQVWEDRHVLLIICILNKYCNGHLICCGVLSILL